LDYPQINIFIFAGNGNYTFLSTVEKEVFIPEEKPIAVLPCTVTNPMAPIHLYKGSLTVRIALSSP